MFSEHSMEREEKVHHTRISLDEAPDHLEVNHRMCVKRPTGSRDNMFFNKHTLIRYQFSSFASFHCASICLGIPVLLAEVHSLRLCLPAVLVCTPCRVCWRWPSPGDINISGSRSSWGYMGHSEPRGTC